MLSRRVNDKLRGFDTPFYFYDMGLLRETLQKACDAAAPHGYRIHYAMKANFDGRILACVKEYGYGIDAVSGNEVRAAIEAGFPASSVVFAGVGKSDREIAYALEQDIFAFNCESRHELEVLNGIAAEMGKVANVALRINPDVDPKTHHYISTGKKDNKFGISYKEVDEVAASLSALKNVRITGIHFHIGSQIRDMKVFEDLCGRVNELYDWFTAQGFELTHVNLGGGLGVNYDDPEAEPVPDFETYFGIFARNLKLAEDVEIHFELGRSLVAQCGELISRVLYNKVTAGGKNVAIIDASMTELIRPALYQAHHAIENIDAQGGIQEYMVAGPVCESSDVFATNVELPQLHRGDLVSLKTAGAYGAAMASRYNLRDLPPAVYSDKL